MKLSSTCEPLRSWPVSPLLVHRMIWDGSAGVRRGLGEGRRGVQCGGGWPQLPLLETVIIQIINDRLG
jgi:hypothetical protein